MKRFVKFLLVPGLAVLSVIYWNSCAKDEDPEEVPSKKPGLTILSPDTNYYDAYPTQQFLVSLMATSNITTNAMLNSFSITRKLNNDTPVTVFDTTNMNSSQFVLTNYVISVNIQTGLEVWTFTTTDVNNESFGVELKFNIQGDPPDLSPVMTFKVGIHSLSGMNYIHHDTTIETGQNIVFGVLAASNAYSGAMLKNFKVTRVYENVSSLPVIDSISNTANFNIDIASVSYPQAGYEAWTFVVVDENEKSASLTIGITTEIPGPDITIYNNVVLGAQGNITGQAFSANTGNVYSISEASTVPEQIEILYYYGPATLATFSAPDDDIIQTFYPEVSGWTTLNSTRFKTTSLSQSQYSEITTTSQIVAIANLPTPPTLSLLGNLGVGDVLAFERENGKYGLILINEINPGISGDITLSIKIGE
jgi:hypothetical protein